jgi:hypothetical protein
MISPALGSGINERLIWANELGAIASARAITSPTINLDLDVICSPFKVAERTQNQNTNDWYCSSLATRFTFFGNLYQVCNRRIQWR